MQWIKIWGLATLLVVFGFGLNETILRAAQHQPSVVSDADLFCIFYSRINQLNSQDVVLLGDSRMQTNFDLEVFHERYPHQKIIQLAQSGRGTPYPVFQDIVEHTGFSGILIVDVNEPTLISENADQQESINHCKDNFSLNDRANRHIAIQLQRHFVFLNPNSSSLRLWGNLVAKQKLPVPMYTETKPDRSQLSDFKRADREALNDLHDSRIEGITKSLNQSFFSPQNWLEETSHWQPLVEKFQRKGGRIVFVRMPVSQKRWGLEKQQFPVDQYWSQFSDQYSETNAVNSVHFADYRTLSQGYNLPDTSHLDMRDRAKFTNALLDIIEPSLTAP